MQGWRKVGAAFVVGVVVLVATVGGSVAPARADAVRARRSSSSTTGSSGPGTASAVASVPVQRIDVAGQDFQTLVVDPGTGRLFAGIDQSTQVFEADGTFVQTLEGQRYPVAAYGSVFTSGSGGIRRTDPATLATTGQWSPSGFQAPTSLGPSEDRLYWTFHSWLDDGYYTCRLLPSDGSSDCTKVDLFLTGGWFGGNMRVVIRNTTPRRLMRMAGAWSMGESLTAYDQIDALGISDDGTHLFAAVPSDGGVHDYSIDGATFTETGTVHPVPGSFLSMKLSAPVPNLLAVDSTLDGQEVTSLYQRGEPAARATFDLVGPDRTGRSAGFSSDGTKLYALVEKTASSGPQLAIADLSSTAGAPTPSVVGTAGGAALHVPVSGLPAASATVGGIDVPITTVGDGVSLTTPSLPAGLATVALENAVGLAVTTPAPVTVVDLGPFAEVGPFLDRQYGDVLGRMPTSTERSVATNSLGGGTTAGQLIADLVRSRSLSANDASLIRLYRAVFLRPPDTAGFKYWLGRMARGTRLVTIAATFAGSSEFTRRYGSLSNAAFVDQIYENVLGRAADPGGKAYWVRKLAAGTSRGTLVAQFSQSSEFVRKTTEEVERIRLVLAMFRRMPTASELAGVADGTTLADIAHGLLASPNYPA